MVFRGKSLVSRDLDAFMKTNYVTLDDLTSPSKVKAVFR